MCVPHLVSADACHLGKPSQKQLFPRTSSDVADTVRGCGVVKGTAKCTELAQDSVPPAVATLPRPGFCVASDEHAHSCPGAVEMLPPFQPRLCEVVSCVAATQTPVTTRGSRKQR